MSLEESKALVRCAIELWSSGDTESVDEIYAADYINYQHHHPGHSEVIRGTEPWKRFIAKFHQAFPDFHDTIEDQIAEGDKSAVAAFSTQADNRTRR